VSDQGPGSADAPQSDAQQQQSQTAYADENAAGAQDLQNQTFSDQMSALDNQPGRAIDPNSVDQFYSDYSARVDPPGPAGPRVVLSTLPLRAETESGKLAPVDLSVLDRGADYQPANPLTDVSLPDDAAGLVRLDDAGVGIRLTSDTASASDAQVIDGDKLFYHEAAKDTDLTIAPVAAGAELFAQLRSVDSPGRLSFHVSVPDGAELRDAGPSGIEVVQGDKKLARISAPTARDANGADVPARLELTGGDGFDLVISHTDEPFTYPILVDPAYEDWYWSDGANLTGLSSPPWWANGVPNGGAGYYNSFSGIFWNYGWGLYLGAGGNWTYTPGDYGQWYYTVPGSTSYISYATFYDMQFVNPETDVTDYGSPYMYWGLWSPAYGALGGGYPSTGLTDYFDAYAMYAPPGHATIAVFGMMSSTYRTVPGWAPRQAYLGGISLELDDPEDPSIGVGSLPSPPQSGWYTNSNTALPVSASDPGLGVQEIDAVVAGTGNFVTSWQPYSSTCLSSPTVPCPASTSGAALTNWPDGDNDVVVKSYDPSGHYGTSPELHVRVDTKGPKIDLSGALVTASHGDLTAGSYPLRIDATDGTTDPTAPPAAHRSGVKNVSVYLDNTQQQPLFSQNLSCATDSCPLEADSDTNTPGTQDWSLNTSQLNGTHTVIVNATDQAGNVSTKKIDLTVNGLAGAIITPKSGDSTARMFGLTAERHDPTMTDVTFQYRRPGWSTWQTIPASQLTLDSDGITHPSSTLLQLDSNGKSPPVTWDVPPTPGINGVDGQINIRARFSTGTPPSQARDNAALFWRLGEAEGTSAADSSGNGRSGAYVGSPGMNWTPGALTGSDDDGAVTLNGTSQYISSNYKYRRNLVANPSLETDTSGWGPWYSQANSISRVTTQGQTGTASLKAAAQAPSYGVVYAVAATAGKTYWAAAQLRAAGGGQLGLHLCFASSSLQGLGCNQVSVNNSSKWGRAIVPAITAPSGTVGAWLIANNAAGSSQDFYVDAAQIEEGSSVDSYFDGSSPGARWEGTPNTSTSVMDGPFQNGTTRTFEGWANRDAANGSILFGGNSTDASAPYLALGSTANGDAQTVYWVPNGYSGALNGVSTSWSGAWPGQGQWVNWALIVNQSAGTAELFINGVSKGVHSISAAYTANAGAFNAGAWIANNGVSIIGFGGKLDEVAVYDSALTPSDIAGLYTTDPQKGFSQVVPVTLSRDDTTAKHASASVGPGWVDLLTGNFSVGSDDVSVDSWGSDLTASRTFNSRQASYGPGPFGPGWISSNPVDSAGSDYISLSFQGSVAKLNESDGTTITFSKNASGDFVPEPGYEDLRLEAASGNYTVTDLDGDVTTFSQVQDSSDYKPVSVRQPGQPNATTYNWDTVGGQRVIRREIAAVPAGVSCPAYPAALNNGCRALDFVYASSTTATGNGTNQAQWGNFVGQVMEIDFKNGTSSTPVAEYQYDSDGRLRAEWDPRISPALKTTYDYEASGRLLHISPPGESLNPWTFTYRPPATNDTGPGSAGRLATAGRPTPNGTATTTVAYGIPLTGGGTPNQMGASDVGAWGQTDVPTDATAVFPADTSPSDPPSSSQLNLATIYYLNRNGDQVNVASPGGAISTTEYEEHREVKRTLTAANRLRVLANPMLKYKVDTKNVYGADGLELQDTYGPLHDVHLADAADTVVSARTHTVTTYDEGAPVTEHPHLPTTVVTGVQVDGETSDRDQRTTKTTYDWKLRQPSSTTVDPSGLQLTNKTAYDSHTGLPVSSSTPNANAAGTDAHTTKTIYYTAGPNSQNPWCGGRPDLAGLACVGMPAGQPTSALPNLPLTWYQNYNVWDEPTTVVETVPGSGEQRTTTRGYDAAGRITSTHVTATGANTGTALPQVNYGYDPVTGRQTSVSDGTRTISRQYDSIGRLAYYTDSDTTNGTTSTTNYDILNRPTSVVDQKGTTTYAYDPTTRRLASETDTALAGPITASYDADGNVTSESMPLGLNALVMTTGYDAAGNATQKSYDSCVLGNCALGRTNLYNDTIELSTHDQVQKEITSLETANYGYDAAGRLKTAGEMTGGQCTTRRYSYDADSNRTDLETNANLGAPFCSPSGATQPTVHHSYDEADRTSNSGYSYDAFGRTLTVPASDAGGGQLTSTYYVDDRVQSLTQGGVTQSFNLDPAERVRLQSTTNKPDQRFHYGDDSDNPAWIDLGGTQANWQRFINDPAGLLAATQVGHGATSDGFSYQLTDLHGDVAMSLNSGGGVTGTFNTDEFGVPEGPVPADGHGYLGGRERRVQFATGIITMGQRVYVPAVGRFLQTDPVPGGSANDYDYVNQDPLDEIDCQGTRSTKHIRPAKRIRPGRIAHPLLPSCDHLFQRSAHGYQGVHATPRGGGKVTLHWNFQFTSGNPAADGTFSIATFLNGNPTHDPPGIERPDPLGTSQHGTVYQARRGQVFKLSFSVIAGDEDHLYTGNGTLKCLV
jgi:RHS repeat-associated protein